MSDPDKARRALDAVTDLMVEDILAAPDEEIITEMIEDGLDPEAGAERGRLIAEKAVARAARSGQER